MVPDYKWWGSNIPRYLTGTTVTPHLLRATLVPAGPVVPEPATTNPVKEYDLGFLFRVIHLGT